MVTKKSKNSANKQLLLALGIISIIAVLGLFVFLRQQHTSASAQVTDGSQVIRMAVTGAAYEPSMLTVEAGKPVTWVVDATQATGCTAFLISSQLGISKKLVRGENIIQFVAPQQKGTYDFSCGMNMVHGKMQVV